MSKLNSEFKVQIKCTAAKQGSFSKFLSRVNHSLLVTSKARSLYLSQVLRFEWSSWEWLTQWRSLEDGPGGQLSHDTTRLRTAGKRLQTDLPRRSSHGEAPQHSRGGWLHQSPERVFRSSDHWPPISPFSQSPQCAVLSTASFVFFPNWNRVLLYHVVLVSVEQHSEPVTRVREWVPSHFSCVWLLVTLWTVAHRLLCPWDSPGKKVGVACHFLLLGIFPTQGLNPCPLHFLH